MLFNQTYCWSNATAFSSCSSSSPTQNCIRAVRKKDGKIIKKAEWEWEREKGKGKEAVKPKSI